MRRIRSTYIVAFLCAALCISICGLSGGIYADHIEAKLATNNGIDAFQVQDSGGISLMNVWSDGKVGILEGGTSRTYYTIFQAGDQTADITYTLPTAQGAADSVLTNNGSGILSWGAVVGSGLWTTSGSDIYFNTGNVGIGTASPSAALEVVDGNTQLVLRNNDAGGGFWEIAQSDNAFAAGAGKLVFIPDGAGSENSAMVLTNGGNVGIGTTSPGAQLEIGGANVNRDLLRFNINGHPSSIGAFSYSTTSPFPLKLTLNDQNQGNPERPFVIMGGNVGIGTPTPGAKLEVAGQVKITGGIPGLGKVLTSDASGLATWEASAAGDPSYGSSASSPIDAVFVNDSGFVGIGTTSPVAKLEVNGGIRCYSLNPGLGLRDNTTDNQISLNNVSGVGLFTTNTASTDWKFQTKVVGTLFDRFIIKADGNVGIGTITPGTPLHVSSSQQMVGYFFSPSTNAAEIKVGAQEASNEAGVFGYDNISDYISIHVNGDSWGSALSVKPGGNVGIGTITPGQTLTVDGTFGLLEGGLTPSFHTIFQGGDQSADITYTLPIADGTTGQALTTNGSGLLSWSSAGGASAINDLSDAISDGSSVYLGLNAGASDAGGGTTNVGLGIDALPANTSGYENTACGYQSLYSNTTGIENNAFGYVSLSSNTTGEGNVAIGNATLWSNTDGDYNSAIGYQSLFSNTTGNNNSAIGELSLNYNQTGSNNVALGYRAGFGVSGFSNSNNIFLGYKAGDNVSIGSKNIVIGHDIDLRAPAGNNTLNIGNLIFGTGLTSTGTDIPTGNVGIGTTSPVRKLDVNGKIRLSGTTPEIQGGTDLILTAVGNNTGSLSFNTTRVLLPWTRMKIANDGNVGIGTSSPVKPLHVMATASNEIARFETSVVGSGFLSLIDVAGNFANLGRFKDVTDDYFFIDLDGGGFGELIVTNSGNVGIGGVTAPSAQLHTTGTVRFANFGAGTLQTDASGNVTASSDIRLKDDVGTFDKGLNAVLGINPINYKWKQETGYDTVNTYCGFEAQNVQAVIPEAVGHDKSGYLTLSDRPIIAALVNAVKELKSENDLLKDRILALESRVFRRSR